VRIRWTQKAQQSFDQIVDFLKEEWSINSATRFVQKSNHFIELLKTQPNIGRAETVKKDLRSFVLTRQTIVFYRIKNEKVIVLLKFFNTRQHPLKKLK